VTEPYAYVGLLPTDELLPSPLEVLLSPPEFDGSSSLDEHEKVNAIASETPAANRKWLVFIINLHKVEPVCFLQKYLNMRRQS
jgi:hypothetical protein